MTETVVAMPEDPHTRHSVAREKVLEHLFVGELLRHYWRHGRYDLEVLRAEIDRGGFDIVLELGGIVRHVQLKTMKHDGKRRDFDIGVRLEEKPSGCVVVIRFDPDSLQLGPYLWLGGTPGEPLATLGEKVVKHTKGNKVGEKLARPALREVKASRFEVIPDIATLALRLFGLP